MEINMFTIRISAVIAMLIIMQTNSIAQPYPEGDFNSNSNRGEIEQQCEGELLLNQQPTDSGVFSDVACDWCASSASQIVADNFTIALPQTLNELVIWGGYYPDSEISSDNWTISIRNIRIDNGMPSTDVVAEPEIIATRTKTGKMFTAPGAPPLDEYQWNLELLRPVTLSPGNYWVIVYGDSGSNTNDLLWEFGSVSPINGLSSTVFSLEFPPVNYFPIGIGRQMALQICGLPLVPIAVPAFNRIGFLALITLMIVFSSYCFLRLNKKASVKNKALQD